MNKKEKPVEKGVDSMNTLAERSNYKRLDFETLNFTDEKDIDEEYVEDAVPIHWAKDVLLGERTVVIKKQ